MSRTLRESVKFTESRASEAKSYRDGINFALKHVLNSGDDAHWTRLYLDIDGNGNLSWYVELHSCPPDWPEAK